MRLLLLCAGLWHIGPQDWMLVCRVGKQSMCACESLACPPAALVDLDQVTCIVLSEPVALHANLGRLPT